MVEKMNAPLMQFNMVQDDMQDVQNRGQKLWQTHALKIQKKGMKLWQTHALKIQKKGMKLWQTHALKIQKKGMTPTPPWAGREVARRRAHGLLDRKPNGETKAVGGALNFEPSPRRHKAKVK